MRVLIRSLSLLLLAGAAIALAADKVALDVLLADTAKYDEKVITVAGAASSFKAKVSKKGNAYFTFRLKGKGDGFLSVYGQGKLDKEPKPGQQVEVTGTFRKEKDMRDFVVKNEIDVSPAKEGEKPGVKLIESK
jgi:hypothetical protein